MQFKAIFIAMAIAATVVALPTDGTTAMDTVVDEYGNKLDVESNSNYKGKEKPNEYV